MHRTRITRVNGKLAIEIPQEMLENLGLQQGDNVGLGAIERGIVIVPVGPDDELPEGIDPDFAGRVDAFIDKYRDALISLADR